MNFQQVEETNCLVAEILKVTSKERFMLEQCNDFLSSLAAMQVCIHVCRKVSQTTLVSFISKSWSTEVIVFGTHQLLLTNFCL